MKTNVVMTRKMGELIDEIRVCSHHGEKVPLLWTIAFPGAEYFCPACGHIQGMFCAGKIVKITPELYKTNLEWRKKGKEYLHAITVKRIKSLYDELSQEEKERLQKIEDNYIFIY